MDIHLMLTSGHADYKKMAITVGDDVERQSQHHWRPPTTKWCCDWRLLLKNPAIERCSAARSGKALVLANGVYVKP